MNNLFRAALQNQRNLLLLLAAIAGMIGFTLASQLEMFSLGVITQKASGGSGAVAHAIAWVDQYVGISENLTRLALFLVFVALFKAATQFLYRYTTKVVGIHIARDLRQEYFVHLQRMPLSFFEKYDMGALSQRVSADATLIAEALSSSLINYLQTPFVLLTTWVICLTISWRLTFLVFVVFPLIVLPIVYIAKRVRRIARNQQKSAEGFAAQVLDFLGGILTIKSFVMEDFSRKKYAEINEEMARLDKKSAKYDIASRPIVHTVGVLGIAGVMIYGLHVLQIDVPTLLVFCGMLNLFYEPIKKFADENIIIQRGIVAAGRMYEVLELSPDDVDEDSAKEVPPLQKEVVFDDVWFGYGEQKVLRGVSFTVERGKRVALVGATGAGKSTIAMLLPRFYDPTEGQILFDGVPTTQYSRRSMREAIAFVPQKPFLFLDTVAANIAFGRNFSRKEIEEAGRLAEAHEFICKLPEGYDTLLSEAGKNLSGGQQQRLAIARALLKKAPILLLDEASSALDMVSERAIKEGLDHLRGKVTQIIIAHRLNTIADADKIIYLEQGRKIAEGTCEELLANCPAFRAMWEAMKMEREGALT